MRALGRKLGMTDAEIDAQIASKMFNPIHPGPLSKDIADSEAGHIAKFSLGRTRFSIESSGVAPPIQQVVSGPGASQAALCGP